MLVASVTNGIPLDVIACPYIPAACSLLVGCCVLPQDIAHRPRVQLGASTDTAIDGGESFVATRYMYSFRIEWSEMRKLEIVYLFQRRLTARLFLSNNIFFHSMNSILADSDHKRAHTIAHTQRFYAL